MKRIVFINFLLFTFSSCYKRLNEVVVKNGDVEVSIYQISEITTMHDFIEVKKGMSTIKIMEANSYGFADVIFIKDTIVIQYMPTVIYEIADKAFNYKVKLDTTISLDYWRQKNEERETLKK